MKEQLKMKHIRRLVALISITLVVCLCLSGCDDDSSSQGVLNVLFPHNSDSQTGSVPQTPPEDQQVMLMFRCEPTGELAKKQSQTEFKVYYSGRVTDEKSGKQSNITGSNFEKLKKYAEDILNKKVESKFEGGNPEMRTTVAAYDKNYVCNQLSAMQNCSIDRFDEMYKIVEGRFS